MAFNPNQFNVEQWLELENENLLQKVCSVYDEDGVLSEQYKTRVTIFPVGTVYRGETSRFAPALYRSFSYDSRGNPVGSVPEMREWTQECEDQSGGDAGLPTGGNLEPLTVTSGLLAGLSWKSFDKTNIDATTEHFQYYANNDFTTLVATIILTYETNKKRNIASGRVVLP